MSIKKNSIRVGKPFLNITLNPKAIKQKTEIFNYIKIKHFCIAKTAVNQTEDTHHRQKLFPLVCKERLPTLRTYPISQQRSGTKARLPEASARSDWSVPH